MLSLAGTLKSEFIAVVIVEEYNGRCDFRVGDVCLMNIVSVVVSNVLSWIAPFYAICVLYLEQDRLNVRTDVSSTREEARVHSVLLAHFDAVTLTHIYQ